MTENHDVLSQYGLICTDDKIIESLKVGLNDAQKLLSSLSMQLEEHTQSSWWFKPWIEDQNYPTLQVVDEVVDDSSLSHSNSLFQSSSEHLYSMLVNFKQWKMSGGMIWIKF